MSGRVYSFPTADAGSPSEAELRAVLAGHPSADDLLPPGALPIMRGPQTTRDISGLRPTAAVVVDADRLGFHASLIRPLTLTPDGSRPHPVRTDYVTVGADADTARVLLRFPDDGPRYSRLLDLLGVALADQLGGTFHFGLAPDPDAADGWQITGAWYDDTEGERH